jgi:hypothetical protein
MFSGHLSLQLVDPRMEHQVNGFMGCDYNIELSIKLDKSVHRLDPIDAERPSLPTGTTTVIERNALSSLPAFRLFHVAAGGVLTLEVLTLRGGDGSLGGGLLNLSTLTIRDSTLVGNRAQVAGALFNSGTFTMTNSTLAANSGGDAVGGLVSSGTATLQNTLLARNISRDSQDCSGPVTSASYSTVDHRCRSVVTHTWGGRWWAFCYAAP